MDKPPAEAFVGAPHEQAVEFVQAVLNAHLEGVLLTWPEGDTVHVHLSGTLYNVEGLFELLRLVGSAGADECDLETDGEKVIHLRLWWD